jgi:hypothetical protein
MTSLRELCDTEYSALGIVNPIRGEETTECCYEDTSTVIFYGCGKVTDLVRVTDEAHVVHEELHTTACDGDTAFECIDWFPLATKVVCDSGQKPMRRDDRLLTNVVQQEATGTVRILCRAGRETLLTDQRRRLVA